MSKAQLIEKNAKGVDIPKAKQESSVTIKIKIGENRPAITFIGYFEFLFGITRHSVPAWF